MTVEEVFSVHAEVVPLQAFQQKMPLCILRARGGSSHDGEEEEFTR